MITNITVVGGTHGNETSGIQLVRNWQRFGVPAAYQALNIDCYLSNQAAIDANVRFLEEDLNRQFTPALLNKQPQSQEARLAHALNQHWGPKGSSEIDLMIDIHNTTSAMGATLIILEADEFHTQLARYVKQQMPEANILVEDEKPYAEHGYLCTLGQRGIMIEVGAQPQGVLRADVYELTHKMALAILDFVLLYNSNSVPALPPCDVFRFIENITFPLDEQGERLAMIHPALQDSDFKPLTQGDPVFTTFSGQVEQWQGDTIYPHFINEAAYHKLHVAFATATKAQL
ncbi:aspartoacylase [Alteromonas lipolytica]|uniref:Aspartoacylase n=1 Tax=Alteromonas lipolytica TaxID=1856405 RepID=A0A1E8FDC4_9ALTE|nr:aspartoacylase [Alteromonas lipolytica]OFI33935.1 aspartoacylase [Alteromonas lipolytica]GGF67115.1 putative aspartoacylase [Alteromonas lipolytica]